MKPATKAAVKTIVKQVLDRNTEDKFVGGIVEASYDHNGAIGVADIYPVLPPVAQGTDYNQRIGEKIRPKYLEYRVRIALNESANLTTPYHVSLFVLAAKRVKSYNVTGGLGANIPINALLDGGNGATGWDATTMNAMMPLNTEMFTQLKRVNVKLSTATAENHKCQTSREFHFRIKCPKTLLYESTASNYPENFAPFTVVGWSRDDGIQPSILSTHVTVTSWAILHYEDA